MMKMMVTGVLSDFKPLDTNPEACGWAVLTESFYEKGERVEFKWTVWVPKFAEKQAIKVCEKKWKVMILSEKLSYRASDNGGIKLAITASKIDVV